MMTTAAEDGAQQVMPGNPAFLEGTSIVDAPLPAGAQKPSRLFWESGRFGRVVVSRLMSDFLTTSGRTGQYRRGAGFAWLRGAEKAKGRDGSQPFL